MQADIKGLIAQFEQIRSTSDRLRDSMPSINTGCLAEHGDCILVEKLVEEYQDASIHFASMTSELKSKTTLGYVSDPQNSMSVGDACGTLFKLEIESKKAVAFLETVLNNNIHEKELNKLEPLRKELKEMSIAIDYERNLTLAIEGLESGHYLASSLISSRVIDRCMDGLPGKTDEEKINFLVKKNIVKNKEKDIKSSIIKAARLARNVLSHNLNIPTPKEAFSLLADGLKLAEIKKKIKNT